MSLQAVEAVLARAWSDALYVDMLFTDPGKALAGFELTGEEIRSLMDMSRAHFDQLAAIAPEERRSLARSLGMNHN